MPSRALWTLCALAAVAACAGCRKPSAENGSELYRKYCASCHIPQPGRTLSAPSLAGYFDRRPRPTARQARRVIRDGRLYMPPFRGRLSSNDIDDVIAYMKTLR
jgi:mono/diheme cytochrome c family protein